MASMKWRWQEGDMTVTRTTPWTGPGCHNGCGLLVYSKDNQIIKVEGDPETPRLVVTERPRTEVELAAQPAEQLLVQPLEGPEAPEQGRQPLTIVHAGRLAWSPPPGAQPLAKPAPETVVGLDWHRPTSVGSRVGPAPCADSDPPPRPSSGATCDCP